jgi:hypothetical protein
MPWDAEYYFGFWEFHCRLFFWFGCSAGCTVDFTSARSIALEDKASPPSIAARERAALRKNCPAKELLSERTAMSETEQREIAKNLFEPSQTSEEIRDALKLEEERRAVLVKNLYRLRALRLSRRRGGMHIQQGWR